MKLLQYLTRSEPPVVSYRAVQDRAERAERNLALMGEKAVKLERALMRAEDRIDTLEGGLSDIIASCQHNANKAVKRAVRIATDTLNRESER